MISRIWHGWTDRSNADAYEEMLRSVVLLGIGARILGYRARPEGEPPDRTDRRSLRLLGPRRVHEPVRQVDPRRAADPAGLDAASVRDAPVDHRGAGAVAADRRRHRRVLGPAPVLGVRLPDDDAELPRAGASRLLARPDPADHLHERLPEVARPDLLHGWARLGRSRPRLPILPPAGSASLATRRAAQDHQLRRLQPVPAS